jgi:hypothetical protein
MTTVLSTVQPEESFLRDLNDLLSEPERLLVLRQKMEPADLLLTHALIVTQDDDRTIVPDGTIAIRGQILSLALPGATARYDAKEMIDLSGQIVFPAW